MVAEYTPNGSASLVGAPYAHEEQTPLFIAQKLIYKDWPKLGLHLPPHVYADLVI